MPEEAKRSPPAPVWNQSFPSPKALFVRGTFFIRCYPLVHSRGRSPIRNLGTRVAAVVPQLASGTATATATATDIQLYLISWCIQNLSKLILKASTVSAETTKSGKLFQTEIILFVKLNLRMYSQYVFTALLVKLYIYAESMTT